MDRGTTTTRPGRARAGEPEHRRHGGAEGRRRRGGAHRGRARRAPARQSEDGLQRPTVAARSPEADGSADRSASRGRSSSPGSVAATRPFAAQAEAGAMSVRKGGPPPPGRQRARVLPRRREGPASRRRWSGSGRSRRSRPPGREDLRAGASPGRSSTSDLESHSTSRRRARSGSRRAAVSPGGAAALPDPRRVRPPTSCRFRRARAPHGAARTSRASSARSSGPSTTICFRPSARCGSTRSALG